MTLRTEIRKSNQEDSCKHFLIYFQFDDSVSIVKEASVVKESSHSTLEVGQICQVKEKKIHEGQIITYGTRDDCVNVEEQYLEGKYTPDFIYKDDAADTDKENQSPQLTKGPCKKKQSQPVITKKGPSRKKKKLTDKGTVQSTSVAKTQNKKKTFPEQVSTIKVLAAGDGPPLITQPTIANHPTIPPVVNQQSLQPWPTVVTHPTVPLGVNHQSIPPVQSSPTVGSHSTVPPAVYYQSLLPAQPSPTVGSHSTLPSVVNHQSQPIVGSYSTLPPAVNQQSIPPAVQPSPMAGSHSTLPPAVNQQSILPVQPSPTAGSHSTLPPAVKQQSVLPVQPSTEGLSTLPPAANQRSVLQPLDSSIISPTQKFQTIPSVYHEVQQSDDDDDDIFLIDPPALPPPIMTQPIDKEPPPIQVIDEEHIESLLVDGEYPHPSVTQRCHSGEQDIVGLIAKLSRTLEKVEQQNVQILLLLKSKPVVKDSMSSTPGSHHNATVAVDSPYTPQATRRCEPEEVLLSPDEVIKKYPKLANASNIGRLAVRLAREAYFGKELMKKSTALGCQDKPRLPKEKMDSLKLKLLSLFPQFAASSHQFEPLWTRSVAAINHHAASLRSNYTKPTAEQ